MHPQGPWPRRDRNEEKDSASCCTDLNLAARSTVSPRPGVRDSVNEEQRGRGRRTERLEEVKKVLTLSCHQPPRPLPLEIGREHILAEETQVRVEILQHRPEDRNVDAVLGCTAREFPGCTEARWVIVAGNEQRSYPSRQDEPCEVRRREGSDHSGSRHDARERENGFDSLTNQKRARGMFSIIVPKPDTVAMDLPQGAPGIVKDSLLAIGGQPASVNASEGASSVPDSY